MMGRKGESRSCGVHNRTTPLRWGRQSSRWEFHLFASSSGFSAGGVTPGRYWSVDGMAHGSSARRLQSAQSGLRKALLKGGGLCQPGFDARYALTEDVLGADAAHGA